jgi:hypothetical protein
LLRALSLAGSSQGATLSAHTKKLTNRVSLPGAEKKTEGGFPWSEQEKQERERELSTIPRTNRDQQESEIRHRVSWERERQGRERRLDIGSREERERLETNLFKAIEAIGLDFNPVDFDHSVSSDP